MKRTLVTGNAGAGKSSLARELAAILDLPVPGLDRVVWQPGVKKAPKEDCDRMIDELASPDPMQDDLAFPRHVRSQVVQQMQSQFLERQQFHFCATTDVDRFFRDIWAQHPESNQAGDGVTLPQPC